MSVLVTVAPISDLVTFLCPHSSLLSLELLVASFLTVGVGGALLVSGFQYELPCWELVLLPPGPELCS